MTGQKASESDIKMLIATQVAHLDLPGNDPITVRDLVNRIIANYEGRPNLPGQAQAQLDTAKNIQERIREYDLQDCYSWVIQDKRDTNAETGFYACLIDTRDGDAVIGFRGTECFDNQLILDGAADVGLLNSTQTTQQAEAEAFTQYVNQEYGNDYENFSFTGHSLGGNLAEHATITAPDGMSIRRCVSYDGPGYSNEYIAAHRGDIERRAPYIDHYQYSLIGSTLKPLPGTNYQTIAAHDGEGVLGFWKRHYTQNIDFDKDGNVQPGEKDFWSMFSSQFADRVDDIPVFLWYVSPSMALLLTISHLSASAVAAMAEMAAQMIVNIGETLGNLAQNVENWFRALFNGVALTGEFEMNVSYVNSLGNGMEDVSGKLHRISGEISDITSKIRYQSLTGTYFKSRLKNLSGAVGRDAAKASSLANAAHSCSQYTVNSDTQAAQLCRSV